MIKRVRRGQCPVRTILVVADTAHPWALLRDRLNPELVTILWARPGEAAAAAADRPWPWAVAATDEAALAAADCQGRPTLGYAARELGGWAPVLRLVTTALARRLGPICLAPTRGVVLPGGRVVERVGELEVLIGAGDDGIALLAHHRRRAEEQVTRVGVRGLLLVRKGRQVALGWTEPDVGAA